MDNEKLKNLITQNAFFSVASQVFYLSTRLFIPPLTLTMVSLEEYGIWAACFVVVAYLGMGVSGIAQTYIRYVGVYHGKGDIGAISRLLSTGATLSSLIGIVVVVGMWFLVPLLVDAFNVPDNLKDMAFILFYGTICIFMVELSWGSFAYVLHGLQRIVEEKCIWIAAFSLEAVLIVSFLFSGMGIYSLLWAFVLRYVFSIGANVYFCYKRLPGLKIRLSLDKDVLKTIVGFGGITQMIGFMNMAMGSIARVLAGFFLNINAVGIFDLGQKFPRMAIHIPASLSMAVFPATAHLQGSARHEEIRKLYLRGSRYINLMTGVIMGFLTAFSVLVIDAWLGEGEGYAEAAALMAIYCLPWHWHTTTGPATAVFKGSGKPLREAVYPLARFAFTALFVSASYVIAGGWTIMGIGWGVAAAILCSTLVYMLYANIKLELSQWLFLRKVLLPGLIPYGIAAALAYAADLIYLTQNRWERVGVIGVAGIIHTAICGALMYFIILDAEERKYFQSQAERLLKKLRR
ncbi:MAG: oligosaccharide flippase family protein [Acidobacteriota bacterium]|nr:oligosaccharide flippase family protein [Acidobacteriota bacterium]